MSDQKKEVLFRIRIDEEATKKRMVDLARQIENNKRVQAELNKEMKAGGVVSDEMIERQQALKLEYEALSKELKTQTQVMVAQQNVDNERLSKLDQLRAQSVLLAAAWNDLTDEEKTNAEVGGQLAKKINEVNVAIKKESAVLKDNKQVTEYAEGSVYALREAYGDLQDQYYSLSEAERKGKLGQQLQKDIMKLHEEITKAEQSVGVFSRNVGNYTTSVLEAIDGSGKLNGAIELMKQGYEKLSGILDSVKESVMEEVKAKIAAKNATDGVTTATNINKAAIIGNVAALKLLKYALVATGIGAILLLLGGLISFLTRTQEGIDKVSRVTKGFTTTLGWLTDQLSAVGKRVWDFVSGFENLGDAVKKLGQLLLDNLISRLKGFLVIWEAVKSGDMVKLQDGIWQVGTGITDATAKTKAFAKEMAEVAKAGAAIEAENQRIRDAEMELNKERAKSRAEIERLKMLSDDTNKSLKERTEAARKAGEMERALLAREIELQQRKVQNIKAEQALTNNLAEDNQKLAEEEAKLYELQEASLTRQTELQNKLLALNKEGADKRREATKKQLAAEAELLGIRMENAQNSEEDILELQIAILKKKTEAALMEENLSQTQILAIKQRALAEEGKLRDEFREEQRRKEISKQEAALEVSQKVLQKQFSKQDLLLKEQRAKGLLTEKLYNEQVSSLKVSQLQAEVIALEQYKGKVLGIEEQIAAKKLEIGNIIADKRLEDLNQQETVAKEQLKLRQELLAQELTEAGMFMEVLSVQFGEMLATQGETMEAFSLSVITLVIDTVTKALEAQVAASVGAATVQAIASAESIATFGVAGVAKALALVAMIRGAATVAKAAITKAMLPPQGNSKGFAEGGYTGNGFGSPDASGYRVAGVVHEGEYVVPKWQVQQNAGLIQALEKHRLRGYAAGGYAGSSLPPSVRQAMGGSPMSVIDYDRLGQSVGKYVPKYIKTTDIKGGLAKDQQTAKIVNQ